MLVTILRLSRSFCLYSVLGALIIGLVLPLHVDAQSTSTTTSGDSLAQTETNPYQTTRLEFQDIENDFVLSPGKV